MTTISQPDSPKPGSSSWSFEKFSEPRTFPPHWDLSEIMVSANGNHRNGSKPAGAASEPAGPVETGRAEESPTWERNPFPQPRTYPAKWDLSG
jgi:hypothetical protein